MKNITYFSLFLTIFILFIGCGSSSDKSVSSTPPLKVEITTSKSSYFVDENITINFKNMLGDKYDWIAIFPKGAISSYKNIIRRKDTNGSKNGKFIFKSINKIGFYEARAFFKDSLDLEASTSFKIVQRSNSTIYEDAEKNISLAWRQISGHYKPLRVPNGFKSKGALVLTPEWIDNYTNIAEYQLDMNNSTQKILEMDMGGLKDYRLPNLTDTGYIQHYSVGVYVTTTYGERRMLWDSFFNHGGVKPFKKGIWLSYPSPVEHVRGYKEVHGLAIDKWVHFRVNVEKELQKLEPNNKVISINLFFATGGFLDNLKLSRK
ncbi:hypothetical protein MNB_SV-14-1536 [hydrothermal vent metagenome]|uniref:Uncharacterized protein n=1 Tax=hydrothermal vent metagenome TaxID=652676 RepID=A0A1W1BFY9_9ZZZZ